MHTRMSGFSSTSTQPSYIRTSISPDKAFFASGRFIVRMAT